MSEWVAYCINCKTFAEFAYTQHYSNFNRNLLQLVHSCIQNCLFNQKCYQFTQYFLKKNMRSNKLYACFYWCNRARCSCGAMSTSITTFLRLYEDQLTSWLRLEFHANFNFNIFKKANATSLFAIVESATYFVQNIALSVWYKFFYFICLPYMMTLTRDFSLFLTWLSLTDELVWSLFV